MAAEAKVWAAVIEVGTMDSFGEVSQYFDTRCVLWTKVVLTPVASSVAVARP